MRFVPSDRRRAEYPAYSADERLSRGLRFPSSAPPVTGVRLYRIAAGPVCFLPSRRTARNPGPYDTRPAVREHRNQGPTVPVDVFEADVPIFDAAPGLGVPIYIHPGPQPQQLRDIAYSGFDGWTSMILAPAAGDGTPRPVSPPSHGSWPAPSTVTPTCRSFSDTGARCSSPSPTEPTCSGGSPPASNAACSTTSRATGA